ncbi:hypothetical protein IW261DRAFT_1069144 [Armillaria novae-zelandiae]|uniref:Uncharacterized protein n=1 Tax=Armillaria novae-zelandiae TaxID=153914 RepID=A0AA39UCA2_9AGAR|nr:hypothetical protein IW261DRAFT_1069144 [Armillaria novae-zelandiae]
MIRVGFHALLVPGWLHSWRPLNHFIVQRKLCYIGSSESAFDLTFEGSAIDWIVCLPREAGGLVVRFSHSIRRTQCLPSY